MNIKHQKIIKSHELDGRTLEWCVDCGEWNIISPNMHLCSPKESTPIQPWKEFNEHRLERSEK